MLHHDLEAVEATGLRYLDFGAEPFNEILVYNAVGRSKKCEQVFDEIAFDITQSRVPVMHVRVKVRFLCSPESCLCRFVRLLEL